SKTESPGNGCGSVKSRIDHDAGAGRQGEQSGAGLHVAAIFLSERRVAGKLRKRKTFRPAVEIVEAAAVDGDRAADRETAGEMRHRSRGVGHANHQMAGNGNHVAG